MKIKSSFIKLLIIKIFAVGLLYLAVTQFDENPVLLSAMGVFCVALLFLKQSTLSINGGKLIYNRHFFIKNKNNYREIPINEITEVRTDVPDAKLTVSMLTVLWLFFSGNAL